MLGIVVVNYREYGRTELFIREEIFRIRIPYRLVVVDNGGDPAQAEALRERTCCEVLVRENDGYAAGCNAGAALLCAQPDIDILLFANNDLHQVTDYVVDSLVDKLKACPEIGIIGPEIVGPEGIRQSPEPYMGLWKRYVWMYLSTPFLSRKAKRRIFCLDAAEQATEGFCYRVMGSFFLCPRDAWEQVGGMDAHTFLYAEESILSERMLQVGRRTYFLPSVTVIHEHGSTIKKHLDWKKASWLQFLSNAYYYRTYKGYPAWQTTLAGWIYRMILSVKR
ncbi:MAG: glycosyltransferase family 2 protein [Bacteroidales bacterium]|nr:glycosyltransferase family 2 protein [Bacteroidales bacterium]